MKIFFVITILCFILQGCSNTKYETIEPAFAQGKVIILQAYGNAGDGSPGGISHSFVELYNIYDEAVDLSGISLYFADGISVPQGQINTATADETWKRIALEGTIPAKGSFLILGAKHDNLNSTRHIIDDNYGDINDDSLSLSRRAFKVALIESTSTLTVQNPFTANDGKPIQGYIDMVGSANEWTLDFSAGNQRDAIFGYERQPARNSASVAIRRVDQFDFDNNSTDFESIDYRATAGGLTEALLEVRRPRNAAETADGWDPFADPVLPPPPPSVDYTKLKLNEVSGVGNDAAKFYELINIGTEDIPLNGVKIYYNANGSAGGVFPPNGNQGLTWTGLSNQVIEAGGLFTLIGRNNPGSFTTGLTAARILIITLEDPEGNVIDQCIRASDTGVYAFTDKSFSRIPDGTGPFYFTTPTPHLTNGTETAGLTLVPVTP